MTDCQEIDLKDIRENLLRITQTELAKHLDVSMRTVQEWEKGNING